MKGQRFAAARRTLVVGVGNELLRDDGLGVHVARLLSGSPLPPDVDVLEAGTSLLDLLPEVTQYARVVIVDAIRKGSPAGTVFRCDNLDIRAAANESVAPLSLHQWGLLDTLAAAERLGMIPRQLTIVGAEPEIIDVGTQLSPTLETAAERIVETLIMELRKPPSVVTK
jgi:hydrogenase maturation protease